MSALSINNVVTISVSSAPAGLAEYNINNLAILTKEVPINADITATNPGIYLEPTTVGADFGTGSETFAMANAIFAQQPNVLSGGGALVIFPMGAADALAAFVPTALNTQFFGGFVWGGYAPNDAEILAAATVVQPLRCMMFTPSNLLASLTGGNLFALIQAATQTQNRMLLYTTSAASARIYAAAYASRLMSTDFAGSRTSSTMHLKPLTNILPDNGISQATLNSCKTVGADPFINFPLAGVFSTGGNDFSDNIYNLNWMVGALQVAGYNAIRTTSTKIPQTEQGMSALRNAYIQVLDSAVQNGFLAPGQWNSPNTFGNPEDFSRNVLQSGYYIYNQPVALQSQSDRVLRKAPLIQIAAKFSGAVQSSNVLVNVEP